MTDLTREFLLWHEALLEHWIKEKTFGSKNKKDIADDMQWTMENEFWEPLLPRNEFLYWALKHTLYLIQWDHVADYYFERVNDE